jgi:hypothetical protein
MAPQMTPQPLAFIRLESDLKPEGLSGSRWIALIPPSRARQMASNLAGLTPFRAGA